VKALARGGRFAERTVSGRDDAGQLERVVVWIERKPGGVWAVGRTVNLQHRASDEPRVEDYVWEGHELGDCLEAANAVLEDDVVVSEGDGGAEKIAPFTRNEILGPLERFFFGRR
jgi:hypothetical protein